MRTLKILNYYNTRLAQKSCSNPTFLTHHLETKILKKAEEEEQNKKDNPKEIFYEFLKLFRKQKKKKKIFSSSAELFKNPEEKKIFWRNGFLKKSLTHTHFNFFAKNDFNQRFVTIFILFGLFLLFLTLFNLYQKKSDIC